MNGSKISIVIPAYNEEDIIEKTIKLIDENVSTPHEILVVNDCSYDRTLEILRNLNLQNLRIMSNEKNQGFVKTLQKGFENSACEIVIPIMADNCDEYKIIDIMYQKIFEGYDMVSGSRYIRGGKRVSPLNVKSISSRMVGMLTHIITGIPTHDISNSFKMFRKDILDKIVIESTAFEMSMEIALKAYFLGYRITEIPTIWLDRKSGQSKFDNFKQIPRYWKWLRFALNTRFKKGKIGKDHP
ncbi:glycosyltransferase family 2 protein [bacterium]|nr:glycosyltransferase family 2 protein [bacterium]